MLTTLDFILVVAKVMEFSTGTFISQFAFPWALVTIKSCRVFFFFTDCAKYSLFTAPCIVIRRYWHRATHYRACSLQENCFCPLLISSWNLHICPSHDPFDTMDKNLTIWMYFHLPLWRMPLVVFFCQHTHLMLLLKAMDHSPKLPHPQQSESDLQSQLLLSTSSGWTWHFCSTFPLCVLVVWIILDTSFLV